MCSHYFSFYSIVTSQCVVEIEKRKSNFTPWSSFFSIFANVTVAECNVFTLFLFYSIVTPKCDVEIEKKKSNVNTFTLLFHFFYIFHLSAGKCNLIYRRLTHMNLCILLINFDLDIGFVNYQEKKPVLLDTWILPDYGN